MSTITEAATARCRSCGAPVVWVVTAKSKSMQLDAAPSPEGRFTPTGTRAATTQGMAPCVRYLPEAEISGDHTDRYTSHFATCPHAASHRRRP